MLELFADPAAVALFGSLGGGLLLKGGEVLLKKRKRTVADCKVRAERIMDIADPLPEPVVCLMWDQRRFEQKLQAEGIETTLSRCEDKRCAECHPSDKEKVAGRKEAPAIGTTNYKKQKNENKNDTLRWRDANAYSIEAKRKLEQEKTLAKMEYDNSRSGRQRVANVSGRMLPIPGNVPKFAHGSLYYDSMALTEAVIWEWHDQDDSNEPKRYFRQRITSEMFDEFPLAPVVKEYAEGEDKDEQCLNCDYSEVEIDQLLDAPVVFRSGSCPDHAKVGDLWMP